MANPNVHDLDVELSFRLQQKAAGEYGETLRTISLNGDAEVARAAFQAAVRCYPHERWLLLWGSYIVEKYEPRTLAKKPPTRRNCGASQDRPIGVAQSARRTTERNRRSRCCGPTTASRNYYTTTIRNCDAVTFNSVRGARFEFRFWSGARDLNPGPLGPEFHGRPSRPRLLRLSNSKSPTTEGQFTLV